MKTELELLVELTAKLRDAEKEIKRLNNIIRMICEGYTFVKGQLPYKK